MKSQTVMNEDNLLELLAGTKSPPSMDSALKRFQVEGDTSQLAKLFETSPAYELQNLLENQDVRTLIASQLRSYEPRKKRGRPKNEFYHEAIVSVIYNLHFNYGLTIKYEDGEKRKDAIQVVADATGKKYDTIRKIWQQRDRSFFAKEESRLRGI